MEYKLFIGLYTSHCLAVEATFTEGPIRLTKTTLNLEPETFFEHSSTQSLRYIFIR